MYFGFDGITVEYGKKTVLDGLSLEVPKGKFVTVIGQNGCGKSTLLKTVSRAVTPQKGTVIFEDRPMKEYSPKKLAKKIAYLAQIHTAPPDIDVRTLVSYGRYPHLSFGKKMTAKDYEIIDNALTLTGLGELRDRAVSTLSGGERQRAWIAMTVAQEPEILVLDEPTTYLDIGYQIEVLELIRSLNTELEITVLTVLHDLNLAARYSDLIFAVRGGNVYTCGSPKEVITPQILSDVFNIDARIMIDGEYGCPFFIPNKFIK